MTIFHRWLDALNKPFGLEHLQDLALQLGCGNSHHFVMPPRTVPQSHQ
jgi:hypothetical protein